MISFRHLSTYALNSRVNAERMERNDNFKNHREKHRLRKIIQRSLKGGGRKKRISRTNSKHKTMILIKCKICQQSI